MNDRERWIASIAYHLWLEEGKPQGRDVEHWLEAERRFNRYRRFWVEDAEVVEVSH